MLMLLEGEASVSEMSIAGRRRGLPLFATSTRGWMGRLPASASRREAPAAVQPDGRGPGPSRERASKGAGDVRSGHARPSSHRQLSSRAGPLPHSLWPRASRFGRRRSRASEVSLLTSSFSNAARAAVRRTYSPSSKGRAWSSRSRRGMRRTISRHSSCSSEPKGV